MIKTQSVTLSAGRLAVVKEVTVKDMRALFILVHKLQDKEAMSIVMDHFDDLLDLINRFCQLPKDESAEDLSGSELVLLWNTFLDVNADFLAKAGGRQASAATTPGSA